MILIINTSDNNQIELILEKDGLVFKRKKFLARRQQAEKLLPAIDKLLKLANCSLKSINKIKVVHQGDSFTSLRIGILTANALAYALGIKIETVNFTKKNIKSLGDFDIVIPAYNHNPDIKIKNNEVV
ncbi:MAG TPA: hypothetical protein PLE28_00030 [bacterium]|nr:hypothetical protein [bacterium]